MTRQQIALKIYCALLSGGQYELLDGKPVVDAAKCRVHSLWMKKAFQLADLFIEQTPG